MFDEYVRSIGASDLIEGLDKISEEWKKTLQGSAERRDIEVRIKDITEKIYKQIMNGKISDQHRSLIAKHYARLSGYGQDALVAVRSSATAEDMPGAAFAGQYKTCLNQQGMDRVVESIKKVWASTYGFDAVNYRNKNGISHAKTKMGVLIMEMINAWSAGTAFSVDTETGASMMTINNTYGLGEEEVSGNVTSDTWVIDPKTHIILKRRLGAKEKRIIYDVQKKKNIEVPNSDEDRRKFAINCDKARQIAAQLQLIHDHYAKKFGSTRFIDTE
jgi:pyruvate,water dikinase